MDIRPTFVAAGLSLALAAYASADSNPSLEADLDSVVTWTMKVPDKMELVQSDKTGMHQPYTIFQRMLESSKYRYLVTFADRGSYADTAYTEPDGKRSSEDILIIEKTTLHPGYMANPRLRELIGKRTYHDEGANGMTYGTSDFIKGGSSTVRMDEPLLAKDAFEDYSRLYEQELSKLARLIAQ